jgi:isopropylmalate/homocitrate/citramalate synthase
VSGSRHAAKDLIEIGRALDELGVRELIVNLNWKDGLEVCEGLAKENLRCKVVGTFRARNPLWKKWVDDGLRTGVDEICFESIPDVEQLKRAANLVQSHGKKVSHAFAEIYSYQEVVDLCREGVKYGYQSQSFHDSFFRFGITPEAIKFFIKSLKADVSQCPHLYVHFSDFYGQGTMTAVAALVAGANAVDVCMNGIGHHCGHVELAEVVTVLEALYGIHTGIKLEKLREVSLLIRERTGIPVPITKPIVGDFAFLTDGAYWAAEADLPFEERVHAKFPFRPSLVGGEERVIWSEKAITPDSVKAKLAAMKLPYQEGDIERIIERLDKVLREKKEYPNWILDSEFEELCQGIISNDGR